MPVPILDALLSEYQEVLGAKAPEGAEVERFREFLFLHGGLQKLEPPGRRARILSRVDALRCFHFSQYLDWYLVEKVGASRISIEEARAAMKRFNEWLFERNLIPMADFEENQESIRGGEEGPPVYQQMGAGAASEEDDGQDDSGALPGVTEEKDFYVPGEYQTLLSGEFVLTKVQEGILYGSREGDPGEVGPILVDRAVSAGSRVGDRVHLSLGKAGDHWNLLGIGLRRE